MITVSNDIKYNASPPSTVTTQPEEDYYYYYYYYTSIYEAPNSDNIPALRRCTIDR